MVSELRGISLSASLRAAVSRASSAEQRLHSHGPPTPPVPSVPPTVTDVLRLRVLAHTMRSLPLARPPATSQALEKLATAPLITPVLPAPHPAPCPAPSTSVMSSSFTRLPPIKRPTDGRATANHFFRQCNLASQSVIPSRPMMSLPSRDALTALFLTLGLLPSCATLSLTSITRSKLKTSASPTRLLFKSGTSI